MFIFVVRRVQVYPEGNDSDAKGRFVSVYLECVSAKSFAQHQKVKAEVEIRIREYEDSGYSYTIHYITCK